MSEKLKKRLIKDEVHARLINWGRWLRWDNTIARLGYPTQAPFVFTPPQAGGNPDSVHTVTDAEHIEYIVSSLYVSKLEYAELYAFVLRVEYAERSESNMPHVSQRSADVRKRFKRPCAERTYYHHLEKARKAVEVLAEPIK